MQFDLNLKKRVVLLTALKGTSKKFKQEQQTTFITTKASTN
jgi:hypothetical protein